MRKSRAKEKAEESLTTVFRLAAVIWLAELVDIFFFAQRLNGLGIVPRDPWSLPRIVLAPFLHGGLGHLVANTPAFLIMGSIIALRRREDFIQATIVSILVGGAGIWIFGPPDTLHIGSSILVFGYFGYLISRSWFDESIVSFLIGIMVILLYGGLLYGLFPADPGISWLGHLFGFIGGVLAASGRTRKRSNRRA